MHYEVALEYLTDWSRGSWILWIAGLLLALVVLASAERILEAVADIAAERPIVGLGVSALLTAAAAVALLIIPLQLARHLQYHWQVLLVVLPLVAWAAGMLLTGFGAQNNILRIYRISAGVTAVLAVCIAVIDDALNRAASSIPTSVGGLVLIGALLAGGLFLWARRS